MFEGLSGEVKKEAEKSVQDVDVATIKAISVLLRGLPLPKEEARDDAETSQLKKCFAFFTNLISSAKSEVHHITSMIFTHIFANVPSPSPYDEKLK